MVGAEVARNGRANRKRLANITKSNAMRHAYTLWDEVIAAVGTEYPDVQLDKFYVDAAAARMVLRPQDFDVLLCTNLFGDILSDLGAALAGGLGVAASGNLNPEGVAPSLFEPVHGSGATTDQMADAIATIVGTESSS
ncbi:MAG: isocitrate/isopropylmalate family dehydrogenase [Thermomicrobiales bacterium]